MEKLLHERLREWSPDSNSACVRDMVNGRETFCDDCTYDCPACASNAAKKLADEIERYYIPLPRDDNGELWNVDDPCIAKGEEGTVAGFDGGEFINVCSNGSHVHFWCDKRYVKRPTPKVYDADGVETKAGDKGFDVGDGCPLEVVGINGDDEYCLQAKYPNSTQTFHIMPERFTHERPVFDAEGERICKGDTVWHVKGSNPWKVLDVSNKGIKVEDPLCSHDTEVFDASSLAHREPDSLKKLLNDIREYLANGCVIDGRVRPWEQRLTALIERGA